VDSVAKSLPWFNRILTQSRQAAKNYNGTAVETPSTFAVLLSISLFNKHANKI